MAAVLLMFEIGHSRNHSVTEGVAVKILVFLISLDTTDKLVDL